MRVQLPTPSSHVRQFAGVVLTSRDGRVTDHMAVAAVAALVNAWRINSHMQDETLTD